MDDQPPQIPDDASPDLHIEVTPLSPSPVTTGGQPAPARPRKQKRLWQAAVIGVVIALALAVIGSGYLLVRTPLTGWALPQPTATDTPEPTPILFGTVPAGCPPHSSLVQFSPSYPPGVQMAWSDPQNPLTKHRLAIWVVGFDGLASSAPSAPSAHLTGGPPTAQGWPLRLGLVMGPDITQPITISAEGWGGSGGRAVLLSADGVEHPTSPLIFDPQEAAPQADGWRSWLFYVLLPVSGCYMLHIQYASHDTGVDFAAGL